MENLWLNAAKRLHAIAETGREFTEGQYDLERYEEISQIALSLLAAIGKVPIESIDRLLGVGAEGYATPKVDVRGAVFNGEKILLVQEKSDGLWTLPGGYADVGLSPAENIEKEIHEEAGISAQATHLYSVRHKAKGEYDPDIRDFYKLFFLCQSTDVDNIKPGTETSDAAFFRLDEIPPLSKGRVVASDISAAWRFHVNQSKAFTRFD